MPPSSHRHLLARTAALLAMGLAVASCRTVPAPGPGDPVLRQGDEISVCGQLFSTGTRVVLWNDPGGYDAYRPHRHFDPEKEAPALEPDRIARYGSFRRGLPAPLDAKVKASGWAVDDLRQVVSQVVIHYDQCGTSQRCFEVLHDVRGLSCHFLLDLDGTIYQTLDLKERAWHASQANDRSVGIEIANIGCYPEPNAEPLARWYVEDLKGPKITYPEGFDRIGLPHDFVGRPARKGIIKGPVHAKEYYQYDLTDEQYQALEQLLTALCHIFPRVKPQMPQDDSGERLLTVLPDDEQETFEGFIAHYHLTKDKRDPGPAFAWERVVLGVQRRLEARTSPSSP